MHKPFYLSSVYLLLAFAAKDILGFYDNFFRILIERKEIKINVFTFHSLKCQKTKNSNPDLYKYVHSKYNTNFNSKAVDFPGGSMKQKIRFGILISFLSILNVFLSGICNFFLLCTVIRVTITKTAVNFFVFILYTNCSFLASYPNDGT